MKIVMCFISGKFKYPLIIYRRLMAMNEMILKEAVSVSVTTLVDNYVDILLANIDHVTRASRMKGDVRRKPLLAEHGFSLFIEVDDGNETHVIVMDFGISDIAMPNNLGALEINVAEAEAFFISHGHYDHIGSVKPVLGALSKPIEVFVHQDAFLQDRIHKFPDGREIPLPTLKRESIEQTGCPIVEVTCPRIFASGYAVILSEIPRVTDFEKGVPTAHYKKDGKIYKDDIVDDQAIVINVHSKGLVVITGCGHSGIINTLLFAQQVTGISKIYAVLGGFHLAGPYFEPVIPITVSEMHQFSPEILVPCHCTGWLAKQQFQSAFPNEFILNSVGSRIDL
jgi:7,8-dihydropterin-6-yl-methyl-4-(beta-D-ribofuranosyl)aminobenzene 5'-phosphate synthase